MPEPSARSRVVPAILALTAVCVVVDRHTSVRAQQTARLTSVAAARGVPATTVFNQYCVGCHNSRLKTAGLQLDSLDADHVADNAQQSSIW